MSKNFHPLVKMTVTEIANRLLSSIDEQFKNKDFIIADAKKWVRNVINQHIDELLAKHYTFLPEEKRDAAIADTKETEIVIETMRHVERSLWDIMMDCGELAAFKAKLNEIVLEESRMLLLKGKPKKIVNRIMNSPDLKRCLGSLISVQTSIKRLSSEKNLLRAQRSTLEGINQQIENIQSKSIDLIKEERVGILKELSAMAPIVAGLRQRVPKLSGESYKDILASDERSKNSTQMAETMKKAHVLDSVDTHYTDDSLHDRYSRLRDYNVRLMSLEKLVHHKQVKCAEEAALRLVEIRPLENIIADATEFLFSMQVFLKQQEAKKASLSHDEKKEFRLFQQLLKKTEENVSYMRQAVGLVMENINKFSEAAASE